MRSYQSLLQKIDRGIIRMNGNITSLLSRWALFIIFFWFGFLKVISVSPADPLVEALLKETLPFSFEYFIVFLGIYEMCIGLLFVIPRCERIAIALFIPHMITAFFPLILLKDMTWAGSFIPTLEGQYIIKNGALIALVVSVASRLRPLSKS